jgi:hypothetical protein
LPPESANSKVVVKSSSLLIALGALLGLTTMRWSQLLDRRTISQIYRDAMSGGMKSSAYQRVARVVSVLIVGAGFYLAFTWR